MDTVNVGRLSIPLSKGQGGPVLGGTDQELNPLRAILNSALTGGTMKDLRRLLENGERTQSNPAVSIARPYPEDDLDVLRSRWEALTGEPAGDDVYILETRWDRTQLLVPRLALISLLDQMEAIRRDTATLAPVPAGEENLGYLEAKAAAADAAQGAEAGAKKRVVLAYLESNGFFDPASRAANWQRVGSGTYPVLEGYLRAVDALNAYYRSAERAEYIQPLDTPAIVGGPVSVDWFRKGVPSPEGIHPFSWLALNESLLRTATDNPKGADELYTRVGDTTFHLRFRREDGEHRALIWAEPVVSAGGSSRSPLR